MNPQIDEYLANGCGSCPLGGTPQCKVHNWEPELEKLREILLECGLTEELKWKIPCYTFQHHNILVMAAFNDYCSISFFKGSLLQDPHNLLVRPGENSQAARLFKFTDVKDVIKLEPVIKEYIFEAIEVEKAGLKVDFKQKDELKLPDELLVKMDQMPDLKMAFESLTPGRQRGYVLFFTAPKQSKTRTTRIEKCIPDILVGKGLYD